MLQFFSGVAASLVATVLVFFANRIVKKYRFYHDAPFSGEWQDEIVNSQGIKKVDVYTLKHNRRDGTITGTIHRILPIEQNYRRCHCLGVVDGNHLILTFWPIRENNISRVNGCMYLKHAKDNTFKGFYLAEHNDKIDMTPITLKKKDDGLRFRESETF